ncbi:hypothetical protein JAAARDRAFT_275314 [Jaapia argillacea MUCL 33604]|uniref:Uncharacterized protein n=1 Tax=Jaapia argillacea MUCL 33604 TaxID=933084 RepID=A0A067Q5A8_9AGAM|nr:hypothetical protein JAAARDRAFT_275314 [Jaapia argillacea MUCL 33604]
MATEGKKRNLAQDPPRITYHTPDRIFERLFKENSLDELKTTARRKLGLSADHPIQLSQLRDEKTIELEDDDDFDAFRVFSKSTSSMQIRVTIADGPSKEAEVSGAPKHKVHFTDTSKQAPAISFQPQPKAGTSTQMISTEPVKKKRKVSVAAEVAPLSTAPSPKETEKPKSKRVASSTDVTPEGSGVEGTRKGKGKEKEKVMDQAQKVEKSAKPKSQRATPSTVESSAQDMVESGKKLAKERSKPKSTIGLGRSSDIQSCSAPSAQPSAPKDDSPPKGKSKSVSATPTPLPAPSAATSNAVAGPSSLPSTNSVPRKRAKSLSHADQETESLPPKKKRRKSDAASNLPETVESNIPPAAPSPTPLPVGAKKKQKKGVTDVIQPINLIPSPNNVLLDASAVPTGKKKKRKYLATLAAVSARSSPTIPTPTHPVPVSPLIENPAPSTLLADTALSRMEKESAQLAKRLATEITQAYANETSNDSGSSRASASAVVDVPESTKVPTEKKVKRKKSTISEQRALLAQSASHPESEPSGDNPDVDEETPLTSTSDVKSNKKSSKTKEGDIEDENYEEPT